MVLVYNKNNMSLQLASNLVSTVLKLTFGQGITQDTRSNDGVPTTAVLISQLRPKWSNITGNKLNKNGTHGFSSDLPLLLGQMSITCVL